MVRPYINAEKIELKIAKMLTWIEYPSDFVEKELRLLVAIAQGREEL